MRFAFNLNLDSSKTNLLVDLHDAATVAEPGDPKICTIVYGRLNQKSTWAFQNVLFERPITKFDIGTVIKLSKLPGDIKDSALVFLRALLSGRAAQVVFDPSQKKYRCVGTMKAGKDEYCLAGTKLTVQADDDESAARLAKREAADSMAEGEFIDEIAGWFKGGCKLSKVTSGKLPDHVKVESLAVTPEEIELAKQPIKPGAAKED